MTHENLAIATNGLLYESSDGTGGIQFYSKFSVSAAGVDDARPQGQVIFRDDGRIEGRKPKGDRACYLWEHNGVYRAGFYNPLEDMPAGSTLPSEGTVVTGMIPIIIENTCYNEVGIPVTSTEVCSPQEQSKGYSGLEASGSTAGKLLWAYSSSKKCLAIVVGPDDKHDITYDELRDNLFIEAFNHAVAFDGSNSVFLNANNHFLVSAAYLKNQTNPMGMGVKCITS